MSASPKKITTNHYKDRLTSGGRITDGSSIGSAFFAALCSGFYLLAIFALLRDYASVEWSYYGYRFDGFSIESVLVFIICVVITSIYVPKKIENPSSLFLVVSYLLIVLPSFACLVAMLPAGRTSHIPLTIAIMVGFTGACIFTRSQGSTEVIPQRLPSRELTSALSTLAVILLIYLYLRFSNIIEFVSLDTLYAQRERGTAENFIDGYAQTYSQYVLSTGLVALGFFKRSSLFIIIGLSGSILNFGITAEKAGLMYPVFVTALFFAIASGKNIFTSTSFLMISFSFILIFAVYTRFFLPFSEFICWYLGTRTILTPGAFVVYYADFFSQNGYTYLSHVRGLNLFLDTPGQYLNDPRWPALGVILGEDYLNIPRLNANASYLATDGIASFGIWGCLVAFSILVGIARAFDYLGRGIPPQLLLPILLSIALTLSNGSSLSVLTSFGGIFWMIAFRFGFRENLAPARRSR